MFRSGEQLRQDGYIRQGAPIALQQDNGRAIGYLEEPLTSLAGHQEYVRQLGARNEFRHNKIVLANSNEVHREFRIIQ